MGESSAKADWLADITRAAAERIRETEHRKLVRCDGHVFVRELPAELIDAARVDGAGWWGIYCQITLPLIKPALITAGLLQFMRQWDAFFWPSWP